MNEEEYAMNDPSTYYTKLIARYLSGEADEGEMHILASWLKETPDNEKVFRQMCGIWGMVDSVVIEKLIDTEAEWAAISHVVKGTAQLRVTDWRYWMASNHRGWLAAAAMFLVVAISAVVLLLTNSNPAMLTLMADGSRKGFVLPDSTLVVLNSGSLRYPEEFTGDLRKVELKGEAWFEVAHDSTKPFVIGSGDLRLEVLGTKFYMESSNLGLNASVVLSEGSVALYRLATPTIQVVMAPGEKVGISGGQMVKMVNTDVNYLAWKTRRISFVGRPLSEVADVLSKVFVKNIVLDNTGLANCKLTAEFDQMPLDSILQIMSSTLDLKVSQHDQTVVLSGKGCR